jgi:hypothetical protein
MVMDPSPPPAAAIKEEDDKDDKKVSADATKCKGHQQQWEDRDRVREGVRAPPPIHLSTNSGVDSTFVGLTKPTTKREDNRISSGVIHLWTVILMNFILITILPWMPK